jgi:3D (Asp-Asp-Asp) domain-containing protein
MKRVHLRAALCLFLVGLASSCSLSALKPKPKVASLKEGTTYEVRKAVLANAFFDPIHARSTYFVYMPPPPPSLALPPAVGADQLTVRTTAYTHSEADHLIYGRKNALGTPLKYGSVRSAAADWSRYPVGTRFRIAGQPHVVYEVDDYGSALVGTNTLDLYCPTPAMMNDWGARHVGVEVLEWGCFHRSADIMKDRIHFAHVRRMFDDIKHRGAVTISKVPSQSTPRQSPAPPPHLRAPDLAMTL